MRLILLTALAAAFGSCGGDPIAAVADSGSDGAADPSGDGDTDGDTDGDGDGDTDDDLGCPGYPSAPHGWNLEDPVSLTTFPAIYGPDGAATELEVCQLYAEHESVKALVFAIGAPS